MRQAQRFGFRPQRTLKRPLEYPLYNHCALAYTHNTSCNPDIHTLPDARWCQQGAALGVVTRAYRPHSDPGQGDRASVVLSEEQLRQAAAPLERAAAEMGCQGELLDARQRRYVSRNWFQARNAAAFFAVARLAPPAGAGCAAAPPVVGGTKWAVQMAIQLSKPVFVFDHEAGDGSSSNAWHQYDHGARRFVPLLEVPLLAREFAGVGTRSLGPEGTAAIAQVYARAVAAEEAGGGAAATGTAPGGVA